MNWEDATEGKAVEDLYHCYLNLTCNTFGSTKRFGDTVCVCSWVQIMLECYLFLYLTMFGNIKNTQFIQLLTLGNK